MCFLKELIVCDCPPAISFDDLPLKPGIRTPVDQLGFPQKCCWCVSIRAAAIMICILSFIWATFELQGTDKFMASLFPSRNDAFYYCKLVYLLWAICFLVACGVLMLGIIVRHELVTVYVWYSFVFCCSYIIIIIGSTIITVLGTGSITKKQTMRTVFSVMWCCVFLYFVIIVNSYKLTLWYKHLGL